MMRWFASIYKCMDGVSAQPWFKALADTRIALPDGLYVAPDVQTDSADAMLDRVPNLQAKQGVLKTRCTTENHTSLHTN
jgi:hypothetical protein